MRNSTYFKMFIAMVMIVFLSFSLLGAMSIILSYRRTVSEKQAIMMTLLQETARYVGAMHLAYRTSLSDMDMNVMLTMNSRLTGFDILLTDSYGVIEACSEQIFSSLGNTIPKDTIESLESREITINMSTLGNIYPVRRHTVGMPLEVSIGGQARTYGYLFVTGDMAMSNREWRSFSAAFVLLAVIIMLLAFAISFIASKKQAEPLNEIASAARRFARGEFDVRVNINPERHDEIGQLVEAFNFMADSMQNNEQLRRDFVANLSHELKTPMTVISGFAEGLLDGTIPRKDEAHYLGIISSETKRLSRLVKSMLEISMLGEANTAAMTESSFDITEVIRLSVVNLSSKIDSKQLIVDVKIPDEPVITRGNIDSVTQVVYNLLDNAVKYSYAGSTVKLELWQQNRRVFVSVSNHGNTIPAQELPNIFTRFHKIDKSRSIDRDGVGLGLYIVKTILDKMGEDIFVTSFDDVTSFMFTLTLAT